MISNAWIRGWASLAASLLLWGCTGPRHVTLFVGTYTEGSGSHSDGIYVLRFDTVTGALEPDEVVDGVVNPSFLTVDPSGRFLYAVNETTKYEGQNSGAVSSFAIVPPSERNARSRTTIRLLNRVSSLGGAPCHLALDRSARRLFVANYVGANTVVFDVLSDGRIGRVLANQPHTGSSVTRRQKAPHPHCVTLDPAERHLVVSDLGCDKYFVYRFDAESGGLSSAVAPHATTSPGSGPRHFSFHPGGRFGYGINELTSDVSVFSYDEEDGRLDLVQSVSTLPEGHVSSSTAEIAVHPTGEFVYGSNRGHDSIVVYRVHRSTGELTLVEHEPVGGRTPRHFTLDPTGRFLLAAAQGSDRIYVFRVDARTGALEPTGHSAAVPRPVCLVFTR